MPPLIFDSVTVLPSEARGRAVLAASHGGSYAAYLAAKAGAKAVILSDAGVGRLQAGISGLVWLDKIGVPAASVGHRSARIGDGADCYARGLISHVNKRAQAVGARVGMSAPEALDCLDRAEVPPRREPPPMPAEHRSHIEEAEIPGVHVLALDSNGLVKPEDAGHIIVTGSHGGLLGGRPGTAVKYDVFAAIYNDADFGIDNAGISRLPALDTRGIAGLTVSAWSACIGDAHSTFRDGFITAFNKTAGKYLVEIGMSTREAVQCLTRARKLQLEGK